MTIPRNKHIYLYNDKCYIVRHCAMINKNIIAQEVTDKPNALIVSINYWKFALKAKHIGKIEISKAY